MTKARTHRSLSTLLVVLSLTACVRARAPSKTLASTDTNAASSPAKDSDNLIKEENDSNFTKLCINTQDQEVLFTLAVLGKVLDVQTCDDLGAKLVATVELKLSGQHIIDISPLKYARSLLSLDLEDNSIQDINPIEALTSLRYLELSNNRIRDISALNRMTEIKMLGISENFVSDLSPLSTLRKLTLLKASRNRISDLSPLRLTSTLTDISIHSNPISDLSPLSNLSELKVLNLQNIPQIADIRPLTGLKKMESLDLAGTSVTDLAEVTNFPLLQTFRVYGPGLRNIESLARLTALKSLEINYLPLLLTGDPLPALNYSFVSQLTSLENLEINDYSSDVNFTFIAPLSKLQRLSVNGNRIQDPTPLSRLTGLKSLNIDFLQSDTSFLIPLTELEYLRIGSSSLSNLNGLSGLTKLKELVLIGSENPLDMSPITGLKNLQNLSLSNMIFSDLEFLEGLNQLVSFDLSRHQVQDISSLKNLPSLRELSFSINYKNIDLQQIRGLKTIRKLSLLENTGTLPVGLETLTGLQELYLTKVDLSDCSSISPLVQLTNLDISHANLRNLGCIEPLLNLKILSISGGTLTSAASLSRLKNLESVDLSYTSISDLSPLSTLKQLHSLFLDETPVTSLDSIFSLKRIERLTIDDSALAADTAKLTTICGRKDEVNDGVLELCRQLAAPP